MRFNKILNELEDIPIKTYKPTKTPDEPEEKVEEPPKFNINSYSLKTGTISANSEEELDKKVDSYLNQAKSKMATMYNYSDDGSTYKAHIVYYDRSVNHIEGKYKKALEKKIDEFAKENSIIDPVTKRKQEKNKENETPKKDSTKKPAGVSKPPILPTEKKSPIRKKSPTRTETPVNALSNLEKALNTLSARSAKDLGIYVNKFIYTLQDRDRNEK